MALYPACCCVLEKREEEREKERKREREREREEEKGECFGFSFPLVLNLEKKRKNGRKIKKLSSPPYSLTARTLGSTSRANSRYEFTLGSADDMPTWHS